MMAATVGMAIGQNSDVTAEAADVVIMDNSLKRVDEFMHISRRMRSIAPSEGGGRHGAERHRHGLRGQPSLKSGERRDHPGSHRHSRGARGGQSLSGHLPRGRSEIMKDFGRKGGPQDVPCACCISASFEALSVCQTWVMAGGAAQQSFQIA